MPTSHIMTTVRRIIAAFASIALITAFIPVTAIAVPTQDAPLTAQAADIARGTSGTCSWVIDGSGKLTIRPTSGDSGTLGEMDGTAPWTEISPWRAHAAKITSAVIEPGVKTEGRVRGLFAGCSAMTSIDLSGLDTSSAWATDGMFSGCSSLESIDLSTHDLQNISATSDMFKDCTSLASLDLGGFHAQNTKYMNSMVRGMRFPRVP